MAPRTRSNRAEYRATQQLIASGQPINAKGLPALPDELYLEIASQFPAMPVPTLRKPKDSESENYHDRHFTLLSLSQTCHALRRVFLRYLWQRVEVYDGMKTGSGTLGGLHSRTRKKNFLNKRHAEELIRQLEVVTIRDPSLAVNVNILNVTILEYSVETVVAELARCIALFPNLHTVQLHPKLGGWKHHTFMSNVFKAYTYPQVRTVCVSFRGYSFLESCPEVVRFHPYIDAPWHGCVDDVLKFSQLEVISAPPSPGRGLHGHSMETLVTRLSNLRDITLDCLCLREGFDRIKPLSKLPNLQTIRLRMDTSAGMHRSSSIDASSRATTEEISQWVKWSGAILSQTRTSEGVDKRVIMTDPRGKVKVYKVEECVRGN